MKKTTVCLFAVTMVLLAGCGPDKSMSVSEQQAVINKMADESLQKLYAEDAATKDKIAKAAGYGVFSNANINIIFASAGGGYGVVTDNATGKKTYMKMGLGGVGLGIGAKDYRQILVFSDKATLDSFINKGWDFGGHADAAAKAGESGGELSSEGDIPKDVTVYSITESGLALQATVTGSKYWKADELNQ